MSANDNAGDDGSEAVRPTIHVPRRRPDARYARAGNVLLPLRFAERMPGWAAVSAEGTRALRPRPAPGVPGGPT